MRHDVRDAPRFGPGRARARRRPPMRKGAFILGLYSRSELWPTRGGVRRTASLLDGILAATKRAVLEALVRASRN